MITKEEIAALMDAVGDAVKGYVAKAISEVSLQFDERIKALPKSDDTIREHVSAAITGLNGRFETIERALNELPKPKDGRSVTIEELQPLVKQVVDDAVATLPPPKNGEDGKSVTLDDVAPLIREAVEKIPKPKNGEDGTSVTVEELQPLVKQVVEQSVAALPPAKSGEDGKSVTLDDVMPVIREAVAQLPKPKDGEDGKSVTVDELLPTVKAWFDALPRPKDGNDGKSVTLDDINGFMESAIAKWALDFERRANDHFQRCLDRMPVPKDGEDGVDGLGFDDFEPTFDGRRTFTMRWSRADKVKEFAFKIPAVLEAGVYTHGKQYEQGDGVTCGGNYWIALVDTKARPGDNNSDWRLAVRKGRDGKDGVIREGRSAGASR
jgi:hypothetical protein